MPDKIIHQIQVDGYCARFGGKWGRLQLGTFGSYGIEQLQITLGDSWTDLVVYANFVTADGTTPVLVPESGLVDVPPEATAKPGMGNIVLDGAADGVRLYSVDIPYLMLRRSALTGEAPAPTPDKWQQFVAEVKEYADSAQKSAEAAAGSAADVRDLVTGAVPVITTARDEAVRAVNTAGGNAVQAVSTAGNSALQSIEQKKTEAVQAVQTAQTTAVGAVNAVGDAKIEQIEQINALVPTPTPEDAGKVVAVKPDGTGYELGDAGSEIDDTVVAPDTTWSSRNIVNKLCPPFSVTGDTVQFTPIEGYPLSVQSTIVATQEGTGDPSPTNVRPIIPVDEVSAWVGGKNFLDMESVVAQASVAYGLQKEKVGDAIRIYGVSIREGTLSFSIAIADQPYLYGKGYIFSWFTNEPAVTSIFCFRTSEENLIAISMNLVEGQSYDFTVQIALSSEKLTAYEPYRGQLYTAQLDEPCYGGEIDLTGGAGKTEWAVFTLNSQNCSDWVFNTVGDQTAPVLRGRLLSATIPVGTAYCTHFASADTIPVDDLKFFSISNYFGDGEVAVRNDAWDSKESALAWLDAQEAAGTPVQLLYQLSTPIPFTIDPLSIPAPASPATAYSTAGEITVEGRSDPIEYINQQIANAIAIAKV